MIDSTAIIDSGAHIADDAHVGPYSIIGPGVEIGSGTRIDAHVVIKGPCTIGVDNHIYPFACIGDDPQDKKFAGEETRLIIGDRNTIREYCTISRGTVQDLGETVVGNDNWIMAYVHIAHDCVLGNQIVMANGASLAGHVVVEDCVVMGGFAMVHQFCRLGAYSFNGYNTGARRDVPPYVFTEGFSARPRGVNTVGLKRNGFTTDQIKSIRNAYKILYRSDLSLGEAREKLQALQGEEPVVERLVAFLNQSERSIVR